MKNTNIDLKVQIKYSDGSKHTIDIHDIPKSVFHEFVEEYVGEISITHIENNLYFIKVDNADFIQTYEKLCSKV